MDGCKSFERVIDTYGEYDELGKWECVNRHFLTYGSSCLVTKETKVRKAKGAIEWKRLITPARPDARCRIPGRKSGVSRRPLGVLPMEWMVGNKGNTRSIRCICLAFNNSMAMYAPIECPATRNWVFGGYFADNLSKNSILCWIWSSRLKGRDWDPWPMCWTFIRNFIN